MTAHKDLKRIIRERQKKTGEAYTAARAQVMRERTALLGTEAATPTPSKAERVEAVIVKVNELSARVRIPGEEGEMTFRSGDVGGVEPVVPGHVVTLVIKKRWTWRGDAYASGNIENPRIDVAKLGLTPLGLEGGELDDVASYSDPCLAPDPYAPLWKKLTKKPRRSYEFDKIAWGDLPDLDADDNPTCLAAELAEQGDFEGARAILMATVASEPRCIDAHAHLGNHEFDHDPESAIAHYEVGMRIAELSLPSGFDGMLPWGMIYNRPFLRCLHGYALCLWRLGRIAEAQETFERILSLNPIDNQGVRFCWDEVRRGLSWERAQGLEREAD